MWLTIYLLQPPEEKHPRVWIGAEDTAHGVDLAAFEAHHLARLFLHVVKLTDSES